MINRTLIRLKVVQMLYAYLLTRSNFHIQTKPERENAEALNAFNVYASTLELLLLITGQHGLTPQLADIRSHHGGHSILATDKLLHALAADPDLKEMETLHADTGIVEQLYEPLIGAIKESEIYKSYSRNTKPTADQNITFWETIISTVIKPQMERLMEGQSTFSRKAIDNGCQMAVKTLRYYADQQSLFNQAKKTLQTALDKAYELYMALLGLAVEITRLEDQQLEAAKGKYLPTPQDLNPDMKFVENRFVKCLRDNEEIADFIDKHSNYWEVENGFMRQLLSLVKESDIYKNYMAKENTTFTDDCELWRYLFQDIILPSDTLLEAMEQMNIYWNDDLYIMGTFVIKSIRQTAKSTNKECPFKLLPQYKDEEDRNFGADLFVKAVNNQEEYRAYIDRFLKAEWDPERIAFMDIVTLTAAIAELVNFPNIPLPVTMNEYTDIAADYSTQRSGQFVNGLLFAVSEELKKEGKIFK